MGLRVPVAGTAAPPATGVHVAVKSVIELPPLFAGAVKDTLTWPFPPVTASMAGAPGSVPGPLVESTANELAQFVPRSADDPAKLPASGRRPTEFKDTEHLANPAASVADEQDRLPTARARPAPLTGTGGITDTSKSSPVRLLVLPAFPVLALRSRLQNEVCGPAVQMTLARFDVSVLPPTVADATRISVPVNTPE